MKAVAGCCRSDSDHNRPEEAFSEPTRLRDADTLGAELGLPVLVVLCGGLLDRTHAARQSSSVLTIRITLPETWFVAFT